LTSIRCALCVFPSRARIIVQKPMLKSIAFIERRFAQGIAGSGF
jgi:hypothetical protein